MARLSTATAHAPDRDAFMHHAYNAVFSGQVYSFPAELRTRVIAEITTDLCRLVRSMPVEAQNEFLRDVTSQVKVN